MGKIKTSSFYSEWKGHPLPALQTLHTNILSLRGPQKPIVWLAGDSSLDNKFWVPSPSAGQAAGSPLPVSVPEIYEQTLEPPMPKPDVAFWLNHYLGEEATCINAAVEASLLRERSAGLLEHDDFIRDHIRAQDILIVSVGANDIALSPTPATALHMLLLSRVALKSSLAKGTAWSLAHFRKLFHRNVQAYISRLVEKTKPAAVLACMIYFPLEAGLSSQASWADVQLRALGYDRDPTRLQAAIRAIFETATAKTVVVGTRVVPVALYAVMDGKNAGDYVERVEPSVEGGRKMAEQLREVVVPFVRTNSVEGAAGQRRSLTTTTTTRTAEDKGTISTI